MQVHLSKYQVVNLQQQAQESLNTGDDGFAFAEEALTYLDPDEVEAIEEFAQTSAEDFLIDVFAAWDGEDPDGVIETFGSMLEDLDIELTYDDDEEEEVADDSDAWDDDDVEDSEPEEFEGY